jgi:hypothetical protein
MMKPMGGWAARAVAAGSEMTARERSHLRRFSILASKRSVNRPLPIGEAPPVVSHRKLIFSQLARMRQNRENTHLTEPRSRQPVTGATAAFPSQLFQSLIGENICSVGMRYSEVAMNLFLGAVGN